MQASGAFVSFAVMSQYFDTHEFDINPVKNYIDNYYFGINPVLNNNYAINIMENYANLSDSWLSSSLN